MNSLNNKKAKKSRDAQPVHQQDKIFRLSNIYLIGHMSHASLHDMVSLSLHGKERGEVQGNKDYLKNRKPMTRGIQCG